MTALSPEIEQLPTKRSTYYLPLNNASDPYRYPHVDKRCIVQHPHELEIAIRRWFRKQPSTHAAAN